MKSVRETALEILVRVETDSAYPNILLNSASSHLPEPDRALLTELINGTLKMQGYLDWVLAQFLHKPIQNLTPWIRNNLRLAVYQHAFLERIPPYAISHEAVKLAKRYGHRGVANLTNAVLRRIFRELASLPLPTEPGTRIAVRNSHPEWLVRRWIQRWGEAQTQRICQLNNESPPVTLRVNQLKSIDIGALQQQLNTNGFLTEPTIHPQFLKVNNPRTLTQSTLYHRGFFYIQDPVWGWVVDLLDPQPGEAILDYCSAPGGKTTYIAERMQNTGTLVALDVHAHRLNRVRENCQRLGITSVRCHLVTEWTPSIQFDRILVDVPCSGLGVLRRRADLRWKHTEADLSQFATLQLNILNAAAAHLKPNGILVYSTCTTEPEENEAVIHTFCQQHPHFIIEPATTGVYGATEDKDGTLHVIPNQHSTDGAFAARLRRHE